MARVLWLAPFPPAEGRSAGAGRMLALLAHLAGQHTIDVLAFADDRVPVADDVRALHAAGAHRVELLPRRPDRRPDWLGLRPALVREWHDPAMARSVAARLDDYALVQVEYALMGGYLPRTGRAKRVWTVHELGWLRLERERARRRGPVRALLALRALQMLHFETTVAHRVDVIVAISADEADELRRRRVRTPVVVLPMGVDTRGIRPAPPDAVESGLVVLVGFFGHAPNVDAALWLVRDVLPRVRAVCPEAHVALVGRDPTPAVRALASPGVVEVTGAVPDVRPWLARAAVVVVPVREGGGVRGKLLEAWAAGRAVVTTRLGAAGLDVRHGENALIADDTAGFAAHVTTLLADPARRTTLAAAGRATAVARYDWDAIAEPHAALWDSLVAGGGP